MGGLSAEREVSLKTGAAVTAALERRGCQVIPIIVDAEIPKVLGREKIDVAFIALHGRFGEDGAIQGLLEIMRIPYTGSGIAASSLAMNKISSRDIFHAHRLPTPPSQAFFKSEAEAPHPDRLPFGLPAVVKPVSEGSSVGVRLVATPEEFENAVQGAFYFGPSILVEKYIAGKEVHVGILNEKALGAIEIRPKGAFYDYSAKYIPGQSRHIFPAPLPAEVYETVCDLGMRAHRALGCRNYSRVDLLLDKENHPCLLEVNSLPGMTETSLMPEIAQGVGMSFDDLVEAILETASSSNERI